MQVSLPAVLPTLRAVKRGVPEPHDLPKIPRNQPIATGRPIPRAAAQYRDPSRRRAIRD
jgi:hypothetical protein